MSTTATIVLVGGLGVAAFLFFRSQAQQQAAVAAAAAAAAQPAPAAGGVTGLAQRLFTQWKGDPLGIKNARALATTVGNVAIAGATEVSGLASSVGHAIGGLF